MDTLKSLITNEKTKGIIAVVAAIIMFVAPDYIDRIVEALLADFGIQKLVIKEEK